MFTRPVGTPEKASNINGEKFLPVNADPSNRVKGVLWEPVALKPLTIKVPTITERLTNTNNWGSGEERTVAPRKKLTPFQCSRKASVMEMSFSTVI